MSIAKRKLFFIFLLTVVGSVSSGCAWVAIYRNSYDIEASGADRIDSGGYVAAGSQSKYMPIWVLQTEENSEIDWQWMYDATSSHSVSNPRIFAVTSAGDDEVIAVGTAAFVEEEDRSMDNLIVAKIGREGVVWQYRYYQGDPDFNAKGHAVAQTSDGGFIVAVSRGTHVDTGVSDAWIIKLDSSGNILLQKEYGSVGQYLQDVVTFVYETRDGNYLVGGDSDLGGHGVWFIKLSPAGVVLDKKIIHAEASIHLRTIRESDDGGYILAATRKRPTTDADILLIKMDDHGNVQRELSFSVPNRALLAGDIRIMEGGDYILLGTIRKGASNAPEWAHIWMSRVKADGEMLWQQTYDPYRRANAGVTYGESLYVSRERMLFVTNDRLVVSGNTRSPGDKINGFFLMKVGPSGSLPERCGVLEAPDVQVQELTNSVVVSDLNAHTTNTQAMRQEVQFTMRPGERMRSFCSVWRDNIRETGRP